MLRLYTCKEKKGGGGVVIFHKIPIRMAKKCLKEENACEHYIVELFIGV